MATPPVQIPLEQAIGLMTAWSARPDGSPDLLVDFLRREIDERPEEVRVSVAGELIMSLTYLCGLLLFLIEEGMDIPAHELLREIALDNATSRSSVSTTDE